MLRSERGIFGGQGWTVEFGAMGTEKRLEGCEPDDKNEVKLSRKKAQNRGMGAAVWAGREWFAKEANDLCPNEWVVEEG